MLYPRVLTLPGARLGHLNADAMLRAVAGPLRRVYLRWPFHVIHAHMLVPDGWAAARVGAAPGGAGGGHGAPRRRPGRARAGPAQPRPRGGGRGGARPGLRRQRRDRRRGGGASRRRAGRWRSCRTARTRAPSRRGRPSEARARLGLPDDGPIVSYVGKLVPRKGVDTLVEAMGLLGRRPRGRAPAGGGGDRRGAAGARAAGRRARRRATGCGSSARSPTTRSAGGWRPATSSCSRRSARACRR